MALGAVGSIICAIKVIKLAIDIRIRPLKVYGSEAEECYKSQKDKIPPDSLLEEYKGGNKSTPQYVAQRLYFDKETMPPEWKKYKKTFSYFYEENGKIMIRSWRI